MSPGQRIARVSFPAIGSVAVRCPYCGENYPGSVVDGGGRHWQRADYMDFIGHNRCVETSCARVFWMAPLDEAPMEKGPMTDLDTKAIRERAEQPKPQPGKESVTDALVERLRERQRIGIERYGRSLETFSGRDMARDAEEELLDLWQYLHGLKMERDAARAELAQAKQEREMALEAARNSLARCQNNCGPDSYCGRCEPLVALVAALDGTKEPT